MRKHAKFGIIPCNASSSLRARARAARSPLCWKLTRSREGREGALQVPKTNLRGLRVFASSREAVR